MVQQWLLAEISGFSDLYGGSSHPAPLREQQPGLPMEPPNRTASLGCFFMKYFSRNFSATLIFFIWVT